MNAWLLKQGYRMRGFDLLYSQIKLQAKLTSREISLGYIRSLESWL